jgi:hypothetical protein
MDNETNPPGRILRHGKQADELTAEAIERRARELALIDGRSPEEPTYEDRESARAELRGQSLPDTTLDDAEGVARITRDPSDPISRPGTKTPMRNEPEEQQVEERLALEGVEEAQHDQMLAARRRRREG